MCVGYSGEYWANICPSQKAEPSASGQSGEYRLLVSLATPEVLADFPGMAQGIFLAEILVLILLFIIIFFIVGFIVVRACRRRVGPLRRRDPSARDSPFRQSRTTALYEKEPGVKVGLGF